MSPTAGMYSGMKGLRLCSSSMDWGVYLRTWPHCESTGQRWRSRSEGLVRSPGDVLEQLLDLGVDWQVGIVSRVVRPLRRPAGLWVVWILILGILVLVFVFLIWARRSLSACCPAPCLRFGLFVEIETATVSRHEPMLPFAGIQLKWKTVRVSCSCYLYWPARRTNRLLALQSFLLLRYHTSKKTDLKICHSVLTFSSSCRSGYWHGFNSLSFSSNHNETSTP